MHGRIKAKCTRYFLLCLERNNLAAFFLYRKILISRRLSNASEHFTRYYISVALQCNILDLSAKMYPVVKALDWFYKGIVHVGQLWKCWNRRTGI